jgi:hypothetical protein
VSGPAEWTVGRLMGLLREYPADAPVRMFSAEGYSASKGDFEELSVVSLQPEGGAKDVESLFEYCAGTGETCIVIEAAPRDPLEAFGAEDLRLYIIECARMNVAEASLADLRREAAALNEDRENAARRIRETLSEITRADPAFVSAVGEEPKVTISEGPFVGREYRTSYDGKFLELGDEVLAQYVPSSEYATVTERR